MDKIIIRDLLLRGIIGINPNERTNKQDILINMILFTDIRPAAATDDITHATNYKTISKRIIDHVEAKERTLAAYAQAKELSHA